MNRDRIAGGWLQFSGKMKERWSRLLGDESGATAARQIQLVGSIRVRHGRSKEEAERQVKDFLYRNRDWNPSRRSLRA